ncbi:terminase large subunit [Aeromicrobium sp.]|uniref:terminase large subunit domain-containing protein n=1 Tax=Aeromicrobium sp. TaxID=1871063 RepID=UPI0030BFB01D
MSHKPGPKAQASMEPLDLTDLGPRDHRRVDKFAKRYLVVPKGKDALSPFVARPWQREIDRGIFPAKGPRPRQGLISLPRGNGKSANGARLALYALLADEVESPQVLVVASDYRQAGIIFGMARRMVELSPELSARCKILKDRIEVPGTNGILMPLPAEEAALQGWDPSLCLVDELHVVTRPVFESMVLASGKREQSLVLALSTPADSEESVMWDLVNLARTSPDPSFYFREWTSDPKHPVDCLHCWKSSNPALGDFLSRDAMRSSLRITRESAFRRLRLGQWLDVVEDSWLTPDLLKATAQPGPVADGANVVLSVDGSFSGDATAITATTISTEPHFDKVGLWEPTAHAEGWRVPVLEVEQAVRDACKRWRVAEVNFDPARWTRSMQQLQTEGYPVREFPQSAQRMTPATVGLYEAFCNGTVTHSGDADLNRHLLNARVIEDSRGTRVQKENKDSEKKIDLAVCSIMGHARALFLANQKPQRRRVAGF